MAKVPAVLVVDENEDSRVEVRKLLVRAGLSVAGEARYGAAAAAAAHQLQPDAIVVGIEEPPNRALETIETLANLLLETPVIAYSSLDEPDAIRRATRAGVRDYLVRPLEATALRESVFAALEQEERRQMRRAGRLTPAVRGSVITVTGAKGGVGKSVVAINLALALHRVTGRSVALVDADTHFGDVATMLNLQGDQRVTDAIKRVGQLDRATIVDCTVPHASGVRVLPGAASPEEWEGITPFDVERFTGLIAEAFDFVVVDTPDIFDQIVEQFILNSTLTLVVTSLDLSSIADTKVALRLLQRWECPPEKVRVAVNATRSQDVLRPDDVAQALNWPVFWTIPYDKRVPEAAQLGESLILQAPRAPFTKTFHRLAGVVSGTMSLKRNGARPGGVRRLLRWLPRPAMTG